MRVERNGEGTWSGLASTSNHALEAILLLEDAETMGLGGNSTAAGHHVKGSTLSNQDLADGSVDVGAGLNRLQDLSFLDVPLDAIVGQY